ncbi:DUF3267 domain-containing protein [Bacillus tianshenii]|nr:DUF3267 domain-containing protein [Bacillus tianshenii]
MMSCWKSINLSKDYGLPRISILSMLVMLGSFICIYLPMSMVYTTVELKDNHVLAFLSGILLVPAAHQLLHVLPAWLMFKKATLKLKKKYGIPVLSVRFYQSMSKPLSILCLGTPLVLLTSLFMIGSYILPHYMHYFAMMSAFNIGLSVTDVIYLLLFLKAPRRCYIENDNDGFDILIKNYY